jgi:hypothetical protein
MQGLQVKIKSKEKESLFFNKLCSREVLLCFFFLSSLLFTINLGEKLAGGRVGNHTLGLGKKIKKEWEKKVLCVNTDQLINYKT